VVAVAVSVVSGVGVGGGFCFFDRLGAIVMYDETSGGQRYDETSGGQRYEKHSWRSRGRTTRGGDNQT
jgi:hypothetical protein